MIEVRPLLCFEEAERVELADRGDRVRRLLPPIMSAEEWDARVEKISQEERDRAKRIEASVARAKQRFSEAEAKAKKRVRRVRRYEWESRAENLGKMLMVPEAGGR